MKDQSSLHTYMRRSKDGNVNESQNTDWQGLEKGLQQLCFVMHDELYFIGVGLLKISKVRISVGAI